LFRNETAFGSLIIIAIECLRGSSTAEENSTVFSVLTYLIVHTHYSLNFWYASGRSNISEFDACKIFRLNLL